MKQRSEKYLNQGCFSSYSLNAEHKSRLENFIKRHKIISETEKVQSKSKSPIVSHQGSARERSARPQSFTKLSEFTSKESQLACKEIELKAKEEQLLKLTKSILASKNFERPMGGSVEKVRSLTPNEQKEKFLAEKVKTM